MSVLCVGLDVAWFGGSAGNPESQYDCVASVVMSAEGPSQFHLERIHLVERDADANQLWNYLQGLFAQVGPDTRIVFAIDAPLQAAGHTGLPAVRASHGGAIERRACENVLEHSRKAIDDAAGGSDGWRPNIQPGAPIAPRVLQLLHHLGQAGFAVWTAQQADARRLAIEVFPAEAIWAAKRQGGYPAQLTAPEVKQYKSKDIKGQSLTSADINTLANRVLSGFTPILPPEVQWSALISQAGGWLTADGVNHGGKLLDDAVDTMICLATALSYAGGHYHVWQDQANPADGHIIGPGGKLPIS